MDSIMKNRIYHLDVLRGLAVLGIFLMNISDFGNLPLKNSNPSWFEHAGTLNYDVWAVIYIFFEGKMRGILSVMFGVSILLYSEKNHDGSVLPMADAYFRRMFWLLFFSVIFSFFLLADTTILYEYAYCGIILFVFRKLNYKWLLTMGLIFLTIHSIKMGSNFVNSRELAVNYTTALEKKNLGTKLDPSDVQAVKAWNERQNGIIQELKQMPEEMNKVQRTFHSGYSQIFALQAEELAEGYTTFGIMDILETIGTVLLGMALFKTKFLRAELPAPTYLLLGVILLAFGVAIGYLRFKTNLLGSGDFSAKTLVNRHFSVGHIEQFHRLSFVFGYISLFIYFCKTAFFKKMLFPLECVGKMAISNYVFQNFISTLIFYGYGLDLYDTLQRYQLVLIVAGLWIFQICFSILWLRYFRMGPLEWCWRSLIYKKKQALKFAPAIPEPV